MPSEATIISKIVVMVLEYRIPPYEYVLICWMYLQKKKVKQNEEGINYSKYYNCIGSTAESAYRGYRHKIRVDGGSKR